MCISIHLILLSFPTRRSSDLWYALSVQSWGRGTDAHYLDTRCLHWVGLWLNHALRNRPAFQVPLAIGIDRKSTRLNSSHSQISYAVFCLKKKSNISWI